MHSAVETESEVKKCSLTAIGKVSTPASRIQAIIKIFENEPPLGSFFHTRLGMSTASNERFCRYWHEVSFDKIGFNHTRESANNSGGKWFPYQKGGEFRKWYGNNWLVVNWEKDGYEIQNFGRETGKIRSHNYNLNFIFKEGVTWTDVTSSKNAFRHMPSGFLFDGRGSSGFVIEPLNLYSALSLLNSNLSHKVVEFINPTLTVNVNEIQKIPLSYKLYKSSEEYQTLAKGCVRISKNDWDSYEQSWDFSSFPLLDLGYYQVTLKTSYRHLSNYWQDMTLEIQRLEEENNLILIDAYGLQDELPPKVPLSEITLTCNPHYRYGGNRSEEELETLLQCDTLKELVSYAIGCMMGRYSLDKLGLVLASQGETVSDYLQQIPAPSFAPDKNAIIPLTDQEWFPDDATNRFRDFVRIVWGEEHLQENLDFVAESLCLHAIKPRKGESALDTIRRYLSTQFFKDHLRTYKKRPIYWLFSSGKQKAFECLVYLHRYNESTLAEMRTDYVIPLIDRLAGHAERLEQDKDTSASAAEAKRIEKELSKLYKQQTELNAFDEKLRHYADQRISLDLDDGVKVNYGKFGDLLAEVKQVAGVK
ncbi:MAG: BREX-1 system adenine-specific DNA-methyltransferase PglX [Halomonas sp.]